MRRQTKVANSVKDTGGSKIPIHRKAVDARGQYVGWWRKPGYSIVRHHASGSLIYNDADEKGQPRSCTGSTHISRKERKDTYVVGDYRRQNKTYMP